MYTYNMYACQFETFCYDEIMNDENISIENYLGALIRRLHQRSTAIFTDGMARLGYDLTPMQFASLKALSQYGAMDQARLADYVACDRATMGGIIDRMERKTWVERHISPKDRRARIARLTPMGEEVLHLVEPPVRELQNLIAANLSDEELGIFVQLLQKSLNTVENRIATIPNSSHKSDEKKSMGISQND